MKCKKSIEALGCGLILLFTYTSISKLMDYTTFRFQLELSPYFDHFSGEIAWLVPSIELIASSLLIFKQTRLAGFYVSFYLMLLFTGYVYAILHFSNDIPCSCGGVISLMSWNQHLIFNLAFTAIAISGILLEHSLENKWSFKTEKLDYFPYPTAIN